VSLKLQVCREIVAFPATEYDEVLSLSDEYPEDEDRNDLRNVGLLTAQPFYPADRPRELHHYKYVHCTKMSRNLLRFKGS